VVALLPLVVEIQRRAKQAHYQTKDDLGALNKGRFSRHFDFATLARKKEK
jgi:hypothetical protein